MSEENQFEVDIPAHLQYIPETLNKVMGLYLKGRTYLIDGQVVNELPKGIIPDRAIMRVTDEAMDQADMLSLVDYLSALIIAASYVMKEASIVIPNEKIEAANSLVEHLEEFSKLKMVFEILHQTLMDEFASGRG